MSTTLSQPLARIHALPERLANQIAAGEVVERPASVLKELLENSLDAGARRIHVDIELGGERLIRVRDDGAGIHREDLALALARHATSKIASLEDLENVESLGFRGEALPSIASVSRLEICSCPAGADSGWKLVAEGRAAHGALEPVPHPRGTTVTVRDLFYNTPARRKFLRSEKTEYRHLEDVLKRAALSRFDCAFSLRHNGREIHALPAAASDAERARRVAKLCGRAFVEQALVLSVEASDLQLLGWIGAPGYSRGVSDLQYFFVNDRMVRDNLLRHAVRHAHHGVLETGRQSAYVLFLHISPAQVDVNVHPGKHEVRFRDARSVHDFIVQSLRRSFSMQAASDDGSPVGSAISPMPPAHGAPGMHGGSVTPRSGLREQAAAYASLRARGAEPSDADAGNRRLGEALEHVDRRYVVARNARGLVVVDARRACRHVAAARLAAALEHGAIASRPLLVPVAITLDEQKVDMLENEAPLLGRLGFDLRRVAPAGISCRGVPAPLAGASPHDLVACAADVLGRNAPGPESSGSMPRLLDALLDECDLTAAWAWDRDTMNELLRELHRLGIASRVEDGETIWRQLGAEDLAVLFEKRRI